MIQKALPPEGVRERRKHWWRRHTFNGRPLGVATGELKEIASGVSTDNYDPSKDRLRGIKLVLGEGRRKDTVLVNRVWRELNASQDSRADCLVDVELFLVKS